MADLILSRHATEFAATTVWLKPDSVNGAKFMRSAFGDALVSVELRKSGLMDLEAVATRRGLTFSVDATWEGS